MRADQIGQKHIRPLILHAPLPPSSAVMNILHQRCRQGRGVCEDHALVGNWPCAHRNRRTAADVRFSHDGLAPDYIPTGDVNEATIETVWDVAFKLRTVKGLGMKGLAASLSRLAYHLHLGWMPLQKTVCAEHFIILLGNSIHRSCLS